MALNEEQLAYIRTIDAANGNRVQAARKLAGATQVEVAEAVGSTQSYISTIERDPFINVAVDLAHRLKDYFGSTIEDLFPGRDEKVSAA